MILQTMECTILSSDGVRVGYLASVLFHWQDFRQKSKQNIGLKVSIALTNQRERKQSVKGRSRSQQLSAHTPLL